MGYSQSLHAVESMSAAWRGLMRNTMHYLRVWRAFEAMGCTWREWQQFQDDYYDKHGQWCLLK